MKLSEITKIPPNKKWLISFYMGFWYEKQKAVVVIKTDDSDIFTAVCTVKGDDIAAGWALMAGVIDLSGNDSDCIQDWIFLNHNLEKIDKVHQLMIEEYTD